MLDDRLSRAAIEPKLLPLFEQAGVTLAVLFGSRAGGYARAGSDVDLAIDPGPDGDIEELRLGIMEALRTERVDVIDLRRAPPLLMMSIAQTGTPIYERDPSAFACFASLAMRRYNDTRKLRAAREEAIANYLEERSRR